MRSRGGVVPNYEAPIAPSSATTAFSTGIVPVVTPTTAPSVTIMLRQRRQRWSRRS